MRKIIFLLSISILFLGCAKEISTVRIAVSAFPKSYMPDFDSKIHSEFVLNNIYESLFLLDNFQLKPNLAENWINYTDKEVYIKLREDVYFHDGSKFDAYDAKASIKHMDTHPNHMFYKSMNIDSVHIQSNYELIIYHHAIDEFRVDILANLKMMSESDLAQLDIKNYDTYANGTGPYKLESVTSDKLVFKKNNLFWDISHKPDIDYFELIKIASRKDQTVAILENKVDLILDPDMRYIDKLKNSNRLSFRQNRSYILVYLMLNGSHVFADSDIGLQNPEMRKAISLAIDQKDIINNLFGGFGEEAKYPFQDEQLENITKPSLHVTNKREAKKIIRQLNLSDKHKLNVSCVTGRFSGDQLAGEYIEQALNSVGINTEVKFIQSEKFYASINHNETDAFISGYRFASSELLPAFFYLFGNDSFEYNFSGNRLRNYNHDLNEKIQAGRESDFEDTAVMKEMIDFARRTT